MPTKKQSTRKRPRKTARKQVTTQRRRRQRAKPAPLAHKYIGLAVLLLLIAAIVGSYYWWVIRPAKHLLPEGRPIANQVELQIALARNGFSPGSIDGMVGQQTRQALLAFQQSRGLPESGELDETTSDHLRIVDPCFAPYRLKAADLAQIAPAPRTWRERASLTQMSYHSLKELLGERFLSSPNYLARLNPRVDWQHLRPNDTILVPVLSPYTVNEPISHIDISLSERRLQLIDRNGRILFHCPVSIARDIAKRPLGTLEVTVRVDRPNYTFNPAILRTIAAREGITDKFMIPPGPNNPVGSVWIGLNRPSYGIHGTPSPEQVGRTESNGCFRLANWNAQTVLTASRVGMSVIVTP